MSRRNLQHGNDSVRSPASGSRLGSNLLFLVGCPRSGTTWLQRLLACHPAIETGQESHIFSMFVGPQLRRWKSLKQRAPEARGGIGPGCYHTEEEFQDLVREYARGLLRPLTAGLAAGELFLEKTPGHARNIPEILQILPRARFIHLIRDPRDVVASLLRASRSWGADWSPKTAQGAAQLWITHVTTARAAGQGLSDEQYTEVHYERLLTDGANELRRLFTFAGLDPDVIDIAGALRKNEVEQAQRGLATPIPIGGEFGSAGSVVDEPEGFFSRASAGSWRDDLSVWEKVEVWRVARKAMRQAGYEWRHPFS